MSENILQPRNPVLFFFSRLLILLGMAMVFMLFTMAIGLICSKYLFGVDVFSNPTILNHFETDPNVLNAFRLIQSLYAIGGFLIPALLFPRAIQQWPGQFLNYNRKPSWILFAAALMLMVFSTPLTSWLVQLNEGIKFPASMAEIEAQLKNAEDAAAHMTKAFIHTDSNAGFLLNILIIAIIPAICEEFMFRGAFMRLLMVCIRNKHMAIALTAFVFSAFHGQFYGFIPRFILGLILGYIAFYSNSIWPAVVAHFFNNAVALFAEYFHWNESSIRFIREDYNFPVIVILLSGIITGSLVWWMRNFRNKTEWYNGE